MPYPQNRRAFLADCSILGASVMGAAALLDRPSASHAIEPIARNGQPKFKFSLAAYSYRDLLLGKGATLSMSDFINDCATMGLEGTELTSYYFPTPVTPEYLRTLKQQCFLAGLDVSGTAIGNDFGHSDKAKQQAEIRSVKQWVDHAEILGAPVIRVFAGHAPDGVSETETHSRMVAALEECCDYAGQHGVYLALENHGGPTATAEGLLRFVRDVQSPWFAVNLDSGNFHSNDAYRELEQIAPYAVNVQIKVVVSGPDGKSHPSDFKRLAKIMRDVGYRGYIVLEYEEPGDPRKECPQFVAQLREAFA